MRRGEIWWVALDPTVGSEIKKTRPYLIVSPDVLIKGLRTVLVAPLTTGGRAASFRPQIRFKGKNGLVILDQVRAVDKARLTRRIGKIDEETLQQTLAMLRWLFAE